jgi:helicase
LKDHIPAGVIVPPVITTIPGLMPREGDAPSLTDAQYDALQNGIVSDADLLVSAPTSTGKTLIGWWAIASALAAGRRAVYLVSHRALAKQKFEEAQRLFLKPILSDDRSTLVCATGDAVEDAFGRKTSAPLGSMLLVATYEKFLGCLSTGGPPADLTDVTFVCDEVQLIGDKSRGQNVELLLTLLKRAGWHQFVGLSAVLSDPDADSLASWLGLKVVRNPTREKTLRIECRGPTATYEAIAAPNTHSAPAQIDNARRQTVRQMVEDLHRKPGGKPTIIFCMKVDDTYTFANEWAAAQPSGAPVRVPPGLDVDPTLQAALSKRTAFHNADLSEDERLFVEERIAAGQVDAVFATSTLAAGVNFPFGGAVFSSWKRWNSEKRQHIPIERADFQNMAGRVGRMGQAADEGIVLLSSDGFQSTKAALELMDLDGPDELGQGIKPSDFGTVALQLFAGKLCKNRDDAFTLLSSTLSASREISSNAQGIDRWRGILDAEIDRLKDTQCLLEARSGLTVTTFGLAVARSGLKPETALYFIQGLVDHGEALSGFVSNAEPQGGEEDLFFVLAHAAIASPEFTYDGGKPTRQVHWRVSKPPIATNPYAGRLSTHLFEQPWMADVGAANGALLVTSWASGKPRRDLETIIPSVRVGTVQSLSQDVAWVLSGIADIVSSVTSPAMAEESKPEQLRGNGRAIKAVRSLARSLKRQAARANSGLPADTLWMTDIDLQNRPRRLSRVQMLGLRAQGLARPVDLMDGSPEADTRRHVALAVETPVLPNAVRDAAKRWKVDDREHCRKYQLRRAANLGAAEIIDALHTHRGDQLEVAFSNALNFVAISHEKIDGKGRIGFPDFLMSIESYPPIVVEIKSKISSTDTVSLNAAAEVLTASELIGMRDSFCVTLCSPGVEPSVPGLIEKCQRLAVVDVADFAEAILRVREGRLTREDFYNWITTPGIALMEDLAPPHQW